MARRLESRTFHKDTNEKNEVNHYNTRYNKFDGMVLECNHLWMIEDLYARFSTLISRISDALKKEKMLLIVTLFPLSESVQSIMNKARFEYLSKYVDYFNIMSYDYISHAKLSQGTMFNAPISWIKNTLDFYIDSKKTNKNNLYSKILLGLPFHGVVSEIGNKQGANLLDRSNYAALLEVPNVKLSWDKNEYEHVLSYNQNGKDVIAVYPTRKVIYFNLVHSRKIKFE
jgi:spore germination protein YaaH